MSRTVPEHHAGSNLSEVEAQAAALHHALKLLPASADRKDVRIVSSQSQQKLQRLDWTVTFAHGPMIGHNGFESEETAVEGERRVEARTHARPHACSMHAAHAHTCTHARKHARPPAGTHALKSRDVK